MAAENGDMAALEVAIVMVPLPAQGHLNQLLHLSLLSSTYGVPVHYAATATHNRQARLRLHRHSRATATAADCIHFHDLDSPVLPSPPPTPDGFFKFPTHLIPTFAAANHHLRVAVIHDSLMASSVQDAAHIPNAELYAFHSVSAFTTLALRWQIARQPTSLTVGLLRRPLLHLPCGGEESFLTNNDLDHIPTLDEFMPREMMEFVKSQFEWLEMVDGRLLDTSRDLEGVFMDMMCREEVNPKGKRHWAIGPFISTTTEKSSTISATKFLDFLEKQKEKSVLYVSFGTTTTMSENQIKEVAKGLEESGEKFIWVLRDADGGDIFSGEELQGRRPWEFLPEGYEERVDGRGLVVREWAPQMSILGHSSTGGFMSHCGWNSCLEALCMGVPVAAWPFHSDQPTNAMLMTKLLRVGVMVAEQTQKEGREVAAAEVGNAARRLMGTTAEGEELRRRAAVVREVLGRSAGNGGTSRLEMDDFFRHISRS